MSSSPSDTSLIINLESVDKEIRPFPATATKIMALCNSSESSVAEIAELIECEPAIAVKLLAMANSPLFATTRAVTNVNQAIVLLGYKSVSQMALTIAAGPLFTSGHPDMMHHRTSLFRQSLGVATVSRLIADKLDLSDPSEAFLGGMMLDVGKLFFFDVVPDHYRQILDEDNSGNTAAIEVEKFGLDHPTIGNRCAQKWGLPDQISRLIQNHHGSEYSTDDGLLNAVVAGIYFAQKWAIGFGEESEGQDSLNVDSILQALCEDEMADSARQQYQSIESIFFNS